MLKYTPNTLKNLEDVLKESGYQIRKGKGNFNTGYCILETKKVIVLNKYHSVEAQINAIIDLFTILQIDGSTLSATAQKWLAKAAEVKQEDKKIVS